MKLPRQPLFVAPGIYRRRRWMDAARMLPVLGGFLFLLPLLWSTASAAPRSTAADGMYFFAVWLGLIVAARLLALALREPPADPADRPDA